MSGTMICPSLQTRIAAPEAVAITCPSVLSLRPRECHQSTFACRPALSGREVAARQPRRRRLAPCRSRVRSRRRLVSIHSCLSALQPRRSPSACPDNGCSRKPCHQQEAKDAAHKKHLPEDIAAAPREFTETIPASVTSGSFAGNGSFGFMVQWLPIPSVIEIGVLEDQQGAVIVVTMLDSVRSCALQNRLSA